jgi:hypothetical protein
LNQIGAVFRSNQQRRENPLSRDGGTLLARFLSLSLSRDPFDLVLWVESEKNTKAEKVSEMNT